MTQQNNTLAADVQQFINNNYFLERGEGTEVLIVEKEKFERVNHADTYDGYGLKIGHEQAQDNHVRNWESEIGERYLSTVEDWQENDWHDLEESTQLWYVDYTEAESDIPFEDWLADAMQQKFSEEETINTCLAYTYFDGNIWQTAIIADSDDFGMGFGYQQLDEENAQSIAEEFFKKEYSRKGHGTNEFVSENYTFIDSYCYGAWANWYVYDRVESYA